MVYIPINENNNIKENENDIDSCLLNNKFFMLRKFKKIEFLCLLADSLGKKVIVRILVIKYSIARII